MRKAKTNGDAPQFIAGSLTTPRKDRLTVLDILRGDPDDKARSYCFNEESFDLLDVFLLSAKLIFSIKSAGLWRYAG